MRVHDMLVVHRHRAADLLDGLTSEQWDAPTLCAGWTVRDVAAHLVTFLRAGKTKLFVGVAVSRGDIERVNEFWIRRFTWRTDGELVAMLHDRAASRAAVPRGGYDPILADLVLHELDIRLPLGLTGTIPEEPLWVSFHHLAVRPALGYRVLDRLQGLRLEAEDTGWTYGSGPVVRGPAESMVLAMAGRSAGFGPLRGDGVPLLRARVDSPPVLDTRRRVAQVARQLVIAPPRERRTRAAVAPPRPL